LQINLDAKKYGTFAEIGAGQEWRAWFFQSARHPARGKTIFRYDMAISDAIYGASDRYVSRKRLQSMLDHEFDLLLKRLDKTRGEQMHLLRLCEHGRHQTRFRPGMEEGQGWLGIKFQVHPHATLPPSSSMRACLIGKRPASRKPSASSCQSHPWRVYHHQTDPVSLIGCCSTASPASAPRWT